MAESPNIESKKSEKEDVETTKDAKPKGQNVFKILAAVLSVAILLVLISVVVWFLVAPSSDLPPEWHATPCEDKCTADGFDPPPLLILSFDGLAAHFLDRVNMKSLNRMAKCGTRAKYMYPSFPTKTFPNHYTIATGMYMDEHEVTDNHIYVPSVSDAMTDIRRINHSDVVANREFYGKGSPIWREMKKQKNAKTACLFFPICEFDTSQYSPDVKFPFEKARNEFKSFEKRIDQIITWLSLPPSDRPSFIAAYFGQPDSTAHRDELTENVDKQLKYVDEIIDLLFESLNSRGLLNCVNVVILSDHGMTVINETINIDTPLNGLKVYVNDGAVSRVFRKQGVETTSVDDIADKFTCSAAKYKTPKVGEVILEGMAGTRIEYAASKKSFIHRNDHGIDFTHPHMRAIFFARGPSISINTTLEPFQNVQLFNLFSDLLQLSPIPSSGNRGLLAPALRKTTDSPPDTQTTCDSSVFSLHLDGCSVSTGVTSVTSPNQKTAFTTMQVRERSTATDMETPFKDVADKVGLSSTLITTVRDWVVPSILKWAKTNTVDVLVGINANTQRDKQKNILFLALHRCPSPNVGGACPSPSVLSFAFPLDNSITITTKCMSVDEVLFTYSASLTDVEWTTGARFFSSPLYSHSQKLSLRTKIHEKLW